jgi:hypothetical protein
MEERTPVAILNGLHHAYDVVSTSHHNACRPISPRQAVGISGLYQFQNVLRSAQAWRVALLLT